MRILLTGANGQLGRELQCVLAGDELILADLPEFDLTDPDLTAMIVARAPEIILHAGAETDVEGCERDPAHAMLVNREGTRRVAQAAVKLKAHLVYISTDYVFDGAKTEPYIENDAPCPLNAYGRSKLMGEQEAATLCPRALIVRTSWLYGLHGKNFVKTILGLAATQPEIRVVDDQRGSPTYAGDLAPVLAALARRRIDGVVHAGGEGGCSWHEFAAAILEEAGLPCRNMPISTAESGRRALRPRYSVLSTKRLTELGTGLPPWRQGLKRFLAEYQAHSRRVTNHVSR